MYDGMIKFDVPELGQNLAQIELQAQYSPNWSNSVKGLGDMTFVVD